MAIDDRMDRDGYGRALRVLHAFHRDWRRGRHPSVEGRVGPDLPTEQWLAADLAALGLAPLPVAPLPGDMTWGVWESLGGTYVVEGSALGARTVIRRVRAAGGGRWPEAGFAGMAAVGGQRWPALMTALGAVAPEREDAVVHGASAAFRSLLDRVSLVDRREQ